MAQASPFVFLEGLARDVATRLPVPSWLVEELQRRLVLLLNHVLQQEPEAMARLDAVQGATVSVHWQAFSLRVTVTPAGLLDLAPQDSESDLSLYVTADSLFDLAGAAARGERPMVQMEGDAHLAEVLGWLVEHVRWDIEEDMARVVGDAQAHMLAGIGRQVAAMLRGWMASLPGRPDRAP